MAWGHRCYSHILYATVSDMNARKTPFVTVNLTEPARDALRQATVDFTSTTGARISMSDVLLAALETARNHTQEFISNLRGENQ